MTESKKEVFIPKNLFNTKENPKQLEIDMIKGGQKVNIIGGKKRITPILLSPKKKLKLSDRKVKEKSLSPDMEVEGSEFISIPNIEAV